MDDIVGAWRLVECSVRCEDSSCRPLGDEPEGMLLYTGDGWMSALLTPGRDMADESDVGMPTPSKASPLPERRWRTRVVGNVRQRVRCSITWCAARTGRGWGRPLSGLSERTPTTWS
jgi:hypothetical protein